MQSRRIAPLLLRLLNTFRRVMTFPTQTIVAVLVSLYATSLYAASANLTWDAPTTWSDSTPTVPHLLNPATDLSGYRLYQRIPGGVRGGGTTLANQAFTSVSGLAVGTYLFSVTALDLNGDESDFSNEVTITIAAAGTAP